MKGVELTDRLLKAIVSPDESIREAACFLAGWSASDGRIDEALRTRLDDSSHKVVSTALVSRRYRADKAYAAEILVQLETGANPQRKTILLDAIIVLVDPGGER